MQSSTLKRPPQQNLVERKSHLGVARRIGRRFQPDLARFDAHGTRMELLYSLGGQGHALTLARPPACGRGARPVRCPWGEC